MLDEHFLDRMDRKVGIDGLAADLVECIEALYKSRIRAALLLDLLCYRFCNLRDAILELCDGLVPFLDVRLAISEELLLGWGAAKQMPLMRAAAQRQAALAAAQQQKEQAQTMQAASEAQNKQYLALRNGEALDVQTGQVVKGTQPPVKPDPNMTPQNLYAVALKDLTDTDPNDPSYPAKQAKAGLLQDAITGAKGGAPKPTQQETWNQRGQEADQLGLTGDQKTFYIVNGKLHEPVASNPRQPTDYDIWKSNPQGWSAYHSAQGDNKGNLTANQRSAIEGKYSSDLNKLVQNYQLDPETGMYNAKDGTVATPQDYEQFKDGIANERFNRYLAAGETPPDLSAASPNPSPVSAHGNSQPAPTGKKSVLPFLPKGKTQRPPLSSFDCQGVTQ